MHTPISSSQGGVLALALLLALTCMASPLSAQTAPERQAQVWAATCMSCHGTGGAASGVSRPLQGMPADEMLAKLMAFRSGATPSTIMRKHVLGYNESELRAIAQAMSAWGAGGAPR